MNSSNLTQYINNASIGLCVNVLHILLLNNGHCNDTPTPQSHGIYPQIMNRIEYLLN